MKGTPAASGICAACGAEGTVLPTYRPAGATTGEGAIREAAVAPLCSACRVREADFHGAVAKGRGEPLFPPAATPTGGASSSDQT